MGKFIDVVEVQNVEERIKTLFNDGVTGAENLQEAQVFVKERMDTANAVLYDMLPDGIPTKPYRVNISGAESNDGKNKKITLSVTNRKHEQFSYRYMTELPLDENMNLDIDFFVDFLVPVITRIAYTRVALYNASIIQDALAYLTNGTDIKLAFTVEADESKEDIKTILEDGTVVLTLNPYVDLHNTDLEELVTALDKQESATVEFMTLMEKLTGDAEAPLDVLVLETELEEGQELPEGKHSVSQKDYDALVQTSPNLTIYESNLLNDAIEDAQSAENVVVYLTTYKDYLHPFLVANLGKVTVKNAFSNLKRSYGLKFEWAESKSMVAKTHKLEYNKMTLFERREKGGELVQVLPTFDIETKLFV